MDDFVLRIYLLEVETQCDFALFAADQFMRSLQQLDQDSFWPAVQSFLVAAANVSKLLWPGRNRDPKKTQYAEARGRELRQFLDVTELSPLSSRKLRDHFEHFDERIDTWGNGIA